MAFDAEDKVGTHAIVAGGGLSLLSIIVILFYTLLKRLYGRGSGPDASDSALFLTLMVAGLFHAIGIMFNIKWAVEGVVTEGAVCTVQGVLKQIGNIGVSFTSLAITVHTFGVLELNWVPGPHFSGITILGIGICTALVVGIPNVVHRHGTYYGDTGFWCYIKSNYTAERLVTDYVWVWLTGVVMVVLYSYMAVQVYRLNLGINNRARKIARKLMLYPIVYIICVLPNTVTRWLSFTNHDVSDRAVLATNALHAFMGFFNFLVFCATRPAMVFGLPLAPVAPGAMPLQVMPPRQAQQPQQPQQPPLQPAQNVRA